MKKLKYYFMQLIYFERHKFILQQRVSYNLFHGFMSIYFNKRELPCFSKLYENKSYLYF